MTTQPNESPRRAGRIAVIAWLLLVTVLAAVNYVSVSSLSRRVALSSNDAQIVDLQNRLQSAEQRLEELRQRPAAVSSAELSTLQRTLESRLSKVEQELKDGAQAEELALLQSRLKTVEAKIAKATRVLASRATASIPTTPTVPEPPFSVLGIEMRGGERVLAIMPAGVNSLAQVRLLRIGDVQDNWRLDGLAGNAADFRVDGRAQRLVVP